MTPRLSLLLGVIALLWSLPALVAWRALGAGSRLVFEAGKWFGYAPAQMVWLADIVEEAGPASRALLVAIWLAGLILLAVIGFLIARAR
ncbi:hypothetical protein [Thermaurantiacus sp.]